MNNLFTTNISSVSHGMGSILPEKSKQGVLNHSIVVWERKERSDRIKRALLTLDSDCTESERKVAKFTIELVKSESDISPADLDRQVEEFALGLSN